MGVSRTEKRAAPVQPGGLLWVVPGGVLIGFVFLVAAQLDAKWFFFLLLSSLILAVSLAFPDRKSFYLALLIFTIPLGVDLNLYFQPSTIRRSTYGFSIHVSYIPLAALYLIWGFRCVMRKRLFRVSTRGLVPLTGLFASGAISVFLAADPLFGIFDLFAMAILSLLFIYAASEIRGKQEVRVVVHLLMVSMGLQGAIAMGQHLTGSTLGLEFFGATLEYREVPSLAAFTRVGGTLGHPNTLAFFFDLLIPLGVSLLFCPMRARNRTLFYAAVVLGGIGLAVTLSRGGITAVGMTLVVILLVRWCKRIGVIRGTLAVATVSALFTLLLFGTSNPVQQRFFRHDYGSAYGRIPHMKVALNIIRDRPFFGVGLNNYAEFAGEYDNTPEQIISEWKGTVVHNLFLLIAGETGLIGLGSFLLFLLAVVLGLFPALRSRDPFIASVGLGALMGILAYLAHSQVDYGHWPEFGPLWFLLGLAVSVGRLASPTSKA